MTIEEVVEKFGHVELKYEFYYKYTFYLSAEFEGYKFEASYGGDASDIYRMHVYFSDKILVSECEDSFRELTITKDGEKIFYQNFYD